MLKFDMYDNVSREITIYKDKKGVLFGTVVGVCVKVKEVCCNYSVLPFPEVYEVVWGNGVTNFNFLPGELNKV